MNLVIKKKIGAIGRKMNNENYDFYINGRRIECDGLARADLEMPAGEIPVLKLEYFADELKFRGNVDAEVDTKKT